MTDKQIIIDGVDVSGCSELVNECDCYLTQEHDYWSSTPYTYNKCSRFPNCDYKQLKRAENQIVELNKKVEAKEQECEELKKQLMQKSDVDMFFNTPIEGWSNDPCGICKYKNCIIEIKSLLKRK